MTDTFPRQNARTRNFTLGAPRSFQLSPDGSRLIFLRSRGDSDPVTCLWALDVQTGEERLIADPVTLADRSGEDDPVERARRERVRERASGIVGFATDAACTVAAFVVAGVVYVADLRSGSVRRLATRGPAVDPRPAPDGRHVAYVSGGALRVTDAGIGTAPPAGGEPGQDRVLADPAGADGITFGLADFIAAEEFGRQRGYWWAPDSSAIMVARVDVTPVQFWHIADPANPGKPAAAIRYPAAGTPNAVVSLCIASVGGQLTGVDWDNQAFPYLITVSWQPESANPLLLVLSRDQREMRILEADRTTGTCAVIRSDTDPSWLDVVPGVPARTASGRIVWTQDSGDARRLVIGTADEHRANHAMAVTPAGLQVRKVLSVDDETVLFSASTDDPASIALYVAHEGNVQLASPPDGVHDGLLAGGTLVTVSRSLAESGAEVRVTRPGIGWSTDGAALQPVSVGSLADQPSLPAPAPTMTYSSGAHRLRTAILLPSWHVPGSARLPVLCDPYGGPHAQRVTASRDSYLTSQWFAEQGFAVVVADGRGTPGRGPAWDRAVAGDLAAPPLEDQVEALHSAADQCEDLDLTKVGIRGWSFGGFLSALAVLRRPDVFHAGIAGAPVTDWRLYDTGYTERYLGHPDFSPQAYERSSLLADAPKLTRPLMIIHGLADDNVVVAHSLRLSSALLAAGRPHAVLPLSGVTHMAAQEEVAENLLLLQVDFLRSALGIPKAEPNGGRS